MADNKLEIKITGDASGWQSAARTIQRDLGEITSGVTNTKNAMSALKGALAGIASATALVALAKASIDAALQMERLVKMFSAASGSSVVAAKELEYIRSVSNRLGLDLVTTSESYGKFLAAIRGTTLEGEKGRRVFESVSGAASALGLSAADTSGVFNALQQMMSKGKVQAEELRGQLGERLPGAFKMAANAMGMTTGELDKQLALGNVMADDLLPKLAAELEKTYGQAAVAGADSAQAAINRMNNAMLESKAALGGALMPVFTDFMTHVLTPIVKLLGDFVRMLQTAAATAAYVSMQAGGGLKDIITGKVFSKDGYAASMADALENERIYKQQMDKIWAKPGDGAYTAAEKLRQAGGKPAAPAADEKTAAAAQKWASTIAGLRKEIDALAPGLDQHDKQILDITLKYDELIKKKGANIAMLQAMKAEHLAAIELRRLISTAIEDNKKELQEYQDQVDASAAAEKSYWQGIADTAKQVESLQPGAAVAAIDKQISDIYLMAEKLPDMAGKAQTAIDALLKFKETEQEIQDINNGLIDDPYQRQLAQIETFYQRKFDLIDQERNALIGLQDANKSNLDQYLKYQKKIEQLDDKETALKREKAKETTETHADAMRSQLSMASFYTSVAGDMFSALAETQDQSSRKGFETAKAFNLAATVMNTASAIMNAFATVPWPASVAAAALAATTGAIQIANIASTSFGGGAKAPSVPSGSFASGGAAGGGTGIGNMTSPLMSIQDSQTQESLERLTASNENVATAIGRLSKSIDDLTSLFEEGGAGYTLANNAPGRFTADNYSSQSVLGAIHSIGTQGLKAFFMPWTVGGALSSISKALFGGSWQTKAAGFALSVDQGQIEADDYLYRKKSGGLFGSSKSKYVYSENNELSDYMNALVQPFINDMERMALTLGTSINTEQYSAEVTRIQTSGKKPEDIAKELEEWTLKTLQGMALTVGGLQDLVGAYDDAYARLKEFNDALVSTNRAFELIGKTALQGSLATGEFLAAVQRDLFGGMEGFNEAIDTYFGSLFTDAEQEAALAAQAQRDLDRAFAEMGLTIPATRQEFRDLVNSLDITTVSGAQLFAGLMDVSEAFGLVMTAADQAAESASEAAQKLAIEWHEVFDTVMDTVTGNLRAAFDAEKAALTEQYNAELATLNEQLQAANGVVSTLTGYVNKLVSARQRMQLQDAAYQRDQYTAAQAMLAATLVAARSGDLSSLGNMDESLAILTSQGEESYANSTDYRRDFMRTKSGIVELERLAGHQLTDAQRQVTLAQQQISTLQSSHNAQMSMLNAQLDALLGIKEVLSRSSAVAAYEVAKKVEEAKKAEEAAKADAGNPAISDKDIQDYIHAVASHYGGGDDAILQIYTAAQASGVSGQQLTSAAGWTMDQLAEWTTKMGLPMFATGGITNGISIAGEAGPEAVVPLPDGRRIPVQMTGSADNAELIAEVRALRGEVIQLKAATTQISKASQKQLQYTEDWDANGLPEVRTA